MVPCFSSSLRELAPLFQCGKVAAVCIGNALPSQQKKKLDLEVGMFSTKRTTSFVRIHGLNKLPSSELSLMLVKNAQRVDWIEFRVTDNAAGRQI